MKPLFTARHAHDIAKMSMLSTSALHSSSLHYSVGITTLWGTSSEIIQCCRSECVFFKPRSIFLTDVVILWYHYFHPLHPGWESGDFKCRFWKSLRWSKWFLSSLSFINIICQKSEQGIACAHNGWYLWRTSSHHQVGQDNSAGLEATASLLQPQRSTETCLKSKPTKPSHLWGVVETTVECHCGHFSSFFSFSSPQKEREWSIFVVIFEAWTLDQVS